MACSALKDRALARGLTLGRKEVGGGGEMTTQGEAVRTYWCIHKVER